MIANRCALVALVAMLGTSALAFAAQAQTCKRTGTDVNCDDGRRGVWAGTAIIWSDGTRSNSATTHPSVIIGNKQSVQVGQGVFVGTGRGGGMVPLDNPNAPNKTRFAILDGVSYCE